MELFQFSEWADRIIRILGYLGLFIVNLVSCGSIFFPLPGYLLVFIFGGIFNPFLVAFFSSIGSAFGELTSYGGGRGGGYFLKKKQEKYFKKGKEWFQKKKGFWLIFLFAATPSSF